MGRVVLQPARELCSRSSARILFESLVQLLTQCLLCGLSRTSRMVSFPASPDTGLCVWLATLLHLGVEQSL